MSWCPIGLHMDIWYYKTKHLFKGGATFLDKFQEELIKIKDNMTKDDLGIQKRRYPKKSFDELIDSLSEKGIKFNKTTREEAFQILREINYYYKLTVYTRLNCRKCMEIYNYYIGVLVD